MIHRMLNWWGRSSKNEPEFWQSYAAKFKDKSNQRVVVLDCETTGLDSQTDRILSIGAIALQNGIICIEDQFSCFVQQNYQNTNTIPVHGITANSSLPKETEAQAIRDLLIYLGHAKIVGHHIAFDIKMLNTALKRMQLPGLKNTVEDTFDLYKTYKGVDYLPPLSLDDLCKTFRLPLKDRHTALGDAFLTAQVYQRLIS